MKLSVLTLIACLIVVPVQAKYSGGTGEPNDPYQIATASDLIAFGETPADYDKHFIQTADIDLDPKLPGRKVFDRAVIAPDVNDTAYGFQGTPFKGVFDGNGHTISHLNVTGRHFLGLFGQLGSWDAPACEVRNLGVADVNITGSGDWVGGLVGTNGGLGSYRRGRITNCYSTGAVSGSRDVGGLVGWNNGTIKDSYAAGSVAGLSRVGGLAGTNGATGWGVFTTGVMSNCYSVSSVTGTADVGGLLGTDEGGEVSRCFWDIKTSGQATSAGGTGKTTAQMRSATTFLMWATCGNEGTWMIDEGRDYPRLRWEDRPGTPIAFAPTLRDLLAGEGTERNPYLIRTAEELNFVGLFPCEWDKHFKLMADIDLSGFGGKDGSPSFNIIGDCHRQWGAYHSDEPVLYGRGFTGIFDGNGHAISHLTVRTWSSCAGLFGAFGDGAQVKNLGVVDANITSSDDAVGSLVGFNCFGTLTDCYSTGMTTGGSGSEVGGLVGYNYGNVTHCYSTCTVAGGTVGGVVGYNCVGTVTQCYSTGAVSGKYQRLEPPRAYAVGGLVGYNLDGTVAGCLWDTQTSGRATSVGGSGKTTAEMQAAQTFLDAGWDFAGETANGTEDLWWIDEGKDYPHLWWELTPKFRCSPFRGYDDLANGLCVHGNNKPTFPLRPLPGNSGGLLTSRYIASPPVNSSSKCSLA